MNHILLEIPAVIVILLFVCFVLVRAFTTPVESTDDRGDIFMTRHTAGNTSQANTPQANAPNRSVADNEPSG
jgi:hypothetical protein